jgi:hypothetical protein
MGDDDPVTAAVQAVNEAIDSLILNPRQRVKHALVRLEHLPYPSPARRALAANPVRSALPPLTDLLGNLDMTGLLRALNDLENQCMLYAAPLPRRSFRDELNDWHARLNSTGLDWSGLEIEYLELHFAQADNVIVAADINGVTLSRAGAERVVTRAQIRDESKPPWQPREEWEQKALYRDMRRAHESALARARYRTRIPCESARTAPPSLSSPSSIPLVRRMLRLAGVGQFKLSRWAKSAGDPVIPGQARKEHSEHEQRH